MNILKYYPYRRLYYLICPWKFVSQTFRNIKYAWQRATRGYCDYDRYSIDSWFFYTVEPMLREFKEHCYSHPYDLTEDEWSACLSEIIAAFEEANRNFDNPYDIETEAEACFNFMREEVERQVAARQRALQLFARHIENLWD